MTDNSLRILVVEDEMMIAFFIEDCLTTLGHEVVGPASRVANAQRLVDTEAFDLALLDINVAGEEIFPVASQLKARGVPFLFLSGYGSRGLREEWKTSPMLAKPFAPDALEASIGEVMQASA
jgi:DNA-binding response OmpR family regulator